MIAPCAPTSRRQRPTRQLSSAHGLTAHQKIVPYRSRRKRRDERVATNTTSPTKECSAATELSARTGAATRLPRAHCSSPLQRRESLRAQIRGLRTQISKTDERTRQHHAGRQFDPSRPALCASINARRRDAVSGCPQRASVEPSSFGRTNNSQRATTPIDATRHRIPSACGLAHRATLQPRPDRATADSH
jgi:hypothetical protein